MFKTNFFFVAILCSLFYGVAQAQIKTHYREEYATVRESGGHWIVSEVLQALILTPFATSSHDFQK